MKSLYKAKQATQKLTSDGAPLKKSNQVPPSSKKKQKTRAPLGGTHKKNMCTKAKFQDKPPYEWVNCYYNCNGNKYRPEFIQGGGGGRGYQGGWGYQGQGQGDECVYHNRRDGRGPGRGNYQGTSGNQVGSNYQGNNNGGQNNNGNNKNNGNNGQHYNSGHPGNNGNNHYQGSNQYSNQGSNQGSINSSGNQGNFNQSSGGNDQHHLDMIGGNQGNNHGGNHNDRCVNPLEQQDNYEISLYTNPNMNCYGTQDRLT